MKNYIVFYLNKQTVVHVMRLNLAENDRILDQNIKNS